MTKRKASVVTFMRLISQKGRSSNINPSGLTSDTNEQWIQEMKNEKFELYYLAQKLVDEDEWHQFLEFLRKPLPTTFRLSSSWELSHDLNKIIQETYIPHLSNVTFEGVRLDPPVQISWSDRYTSFSYSLTPQDVSVNIGLAWHLNVPKPALRRSPEFKRFHNFLGNISRQEAVSMIPPLLLGVESNHLTAQLLEALHKTQSRLETIPSGIVIANDSDFKRTHLLVHQSSRLPSPAFMVTNLDASSFPKIFVDSHNHQSIKFDRILCDVPCSGDGTLRKNLNIWRHWQSTDGNGLHALQMRILTRAMKLLKPNGRIVYSTCSFNPVENEAVVAGALQNHPEFEIVDVSSDLPNLARKPGLVTWYPVVNKELVHYPSYDDYLTYWKNIDGPKSVPKMVPTHWPPSNAEDLNLHRWYVFTDICFLQLMFLLQRKATSLTEDELKSIELSKRKRTASHELDSRGHESKRSKVDENFAVKNELECVDDPVRNDTGNSSRFKEAPYSFLDISHPQLKQLMNHLQLLPSFPVSNLFVRNPEGAGSSVSLRSIYLCNDMVKCIVEANDYSRLRLVSVGTKLFTRQDGGENDKSLDTTTVTRRRFRILADGVPTLLPYIPRDMVCLGNKDDLKQLLESYHPLINDLSEPFRSQIVAKGGRREEAMANVTAHEESSRMDDDGKHKTVQIE
ncbi:hypothetical protein Clacol_004763 [Clathrus columnatus]|uniref:SAM-dependent MTase RsmB/NOP-type domain-containing protein n=1 Tax=Clathrus columnatus TaxID=1419009 RepID=A0AAV5ADG8_9AGAM|nr:hypothetical protein Clacol_004763 [Clathrus columnatus]